MRSKRQYEFVHPLSKTTLSDMYRCHEVQNGDPVREVAIKLLRDSWKDKPQSVTWLRQELSLLQSLHHSAIPTIYEMTSIRGRYCCDGVGGWTRFKKSGARNAQNETTHSPKVTSV